MAIFSFDTNKSYGISLIIIVAIHLGITSKILREA